MATVTTVQYGYTFGRPGYSSERIDLTAQLGEGEDPAVATLVLKAEVLRLGGDERGAELAMQEAAERAAGGGGRPA